MLDYNKFIEEAKQEDIPMLIFPTVYKEALGKEIFLGWDELVKKPMVKVGFKTGSLITELFPGPDSWRDEEPSTPKMLINDIESLACGNEEDQGFYYFGLSLSFLCGSLVSATMEVITGGNVVDNNFLN